MYQKIKAYIKKNEMLKTGDKVVVGVSGGADSVCLLFMLLELRREYDLELFVVHIHHGIRGDTADADAEYTKDICRKFNVECQIFHEDVLEYAKQQHLTVEEAGRNIRRQRFEQVRREKSADKIALAHHQNDNAETLLWNLCRGSGLNGLGGIAPVDGVYIRPLLCVQRKEIESYLKKREISYCIDETNEEDHYTRNRIRNHVIPYLESEINEQTVAHMSETMEQMRKLGEYVKTEVERYLENCAECGKDSTWLLKKKEYLEVPETLRHYVLHELLCRIAEHKKDVESVHVRLLEGLMDHQTGHEIHLPYQIQAVRNYEGIFLRKGSAGCRKRGMQKTQDGESGSTPEEMFVTRVFEREAGPVLFPKSIYTKWFDYAIIKNAVKIRHREAGDYITIDRNGKTQKLKQYFINEKIPADMRDKIWLVADGHHIMWIVGYRQNQRYQITENTREVLEIKLNGGESHGREC